MTHGPPVEFVATLTFEIEPEGAPTCETAIRWMLSPLDVMFELPTTPSADTEFKRFKSFEPHFLGGPAALIALDLNSDPKIRRAMLLEIIGGELCRNAFEERLDVERLYCEYRCLSQPPAKPDRKEFLSKEFIICPTNRTFAP